MGEQRSDTDCRFIKAYANQEATALILNSQASNHQKKRHLVCGCLCVYTHFCVFIEIALDLSLCAF